MTAPDLFICLSGLAATAALIISTRRELQRWAKLPAEVEGDQFKKYARGYRGVRRPRDYGKRGRLK